MQWLYRPLLWPYGKGPVTSDFQAYVDVIHHVEEACQASTVKTASVGMEAVADPPSDSGGGGGIALPGLFSLLGLVLITVRVRQRRDLHGTSSMIQ